MIYAFIFWNLLLGHPSKTIVYNFETLESCKLFQEEMVKQATEITKSGCYPQKGKVELPQ